ncbi:MAG: hypothetical protein IKO14_10545 [Oscillibacter sp.]|nr:hypothetical protein [Oscillibacter sp.]
MNVWKKAGALALALTLAAYINVSSLALREELTSPDGAPEDTGAVSAPEADTETEAEKVIAAPVEDITEEPTETVVRSASTGGHAKKPAKVSTKEPVEEVTGEPVEEAAGEAVADWAGEIFVEPVEESAGEVVPDWAGEIFMEPVAESAGEPVADWTGEIFVEPVGESVEDTGETAQAAVKSYEHYEKAALFGEVAPDTDTESGSDAPTVAEPVEDLSEPKPVTESEPVAESTPKPEPVEEETAAPVEDPAPEPVAESTPETVSGGGTDTPPTPETSEETTPETSGGATPDAEIGLAPNEDEHARLFGLEGEPPSDPPSPTGVSLSTVPYLLLLCGGCALLLTLPRRRRYT